jgi:hypothetical protein
MGGIAFGVPELAKHLSQILSKAGAQLTLQLHRPRGCGLLIGRGTLADRSALVASACTGRILTRRSDVELQAEGGGNTLQGGAQRGAPLHEAPNLPDGDPGTDGERPQPLTLDMGPYR